MRQKIYSHDTVQLPDLMYLHYAAIALRVCHARTQPLDFLSFRFSIEYLIFLIGSVIFETKVSALFWAVFLEEPSVETMTALLPSAQHLYEELMLTPYMAKFVILHRPHAPHAWCDTLRVICVTDDKAESWGEIANPLWTTVATTDEMVCFIRALCSFGPLVG